MTKQILILGIARNGKSLFAEMLRDIYGFSFTDSSRAALDVIYPVLQADHGYNTKDEAFNDRFRHRSQWKELICEYNSPDKTKLTQLILADNDIYVGMRCKEEYAVTKHMFDVILWVDGSARCGNTDETMTIEFNDDTDRMILVDNNAGVAQLLEKAHDLRELLTGE